jgi:hypothetical protein
MRNGLCSGLVCGNVLVKPEDHLHVPIGARHGRHAGTAFPARLRSHSSSRPTRLANSFNGKTGSEQPQPATAEDLANTRPYPHNMVIGMPLPKRTLRADTFPASKAEKCRNFPNRLARTLNRYTTDQVLRSFAYENTLSYQKEWGQRARRRPPAGSSRRGNHSYDCSRYQLSHNRSKG